MVWKQKKQTYIQSGISQTYTGTQELIDSEGGLTGYSTEIVRKFYRKMDLKSRIEETNGSILEFGAGTGFLAEIFRTQFQISPDCVELDLSLVEYIRSRNFSCYQFLTQTPKKYEAIYTSNVLEHIEDDLGSLRDLHEKLLPGGVIGIYVPAHPFLYSDMDAQIGHVRRYKKSELKDKVLSAGFEISSLTYDESLGFFAAFIVKIIGYKNGAQLGSRKSLIFYDKLIYPVSRILDLLGFRYIIGKNLLIIANKES